MCNQVEVFTRLELYPALIGRYFPKFRDIVSFPLHRPKKVITPGCTERSVTAYQRCVTSQKSAVVIYVARGIMVLGWPKGYKHYAAGSQYYVTLHCLSFFTKCLVCEFPKFCVFVKQKLLSHRLFCH